MKITHYSSLITGLLILISLCIPAQAADQPPESGNFLVRTGADQDYKPSVLLGTDVDIQITGPIARVSVKQQFYNPSSEFVEGKYVFPLPEKAAINAMTLHIGERIIKGEIHEKEQAQKIYQQAAREGKHAGLVEQQRANLFTTQIANIAPHETILVEIIYIDTLARIGNEFSFYFPMTLTPRYMPAPTNDIASTLDTGFIFGKDIPAELANPARIKVRINDVINLQNIRSSSHKISQKQRNDHWLITTKETYIPMDSDFKLQWKISSAQNHTPAFFVDELNGEHYGVLMLMPPETPAAKDIIARDSVFIIDTSGSMSGQSIEQAKAGLVFAINHLNEQQLFNIIEFNSIHQKLFAQSQRATTDAKQQALAFVASLQATGGTEMAPALRTALTLPSDPEYLRQIIFITDGAVSNEDELFSIIHQLLGESRLFTVGIGSAPNSYFMKKAAEFGRGTQTSISQLSDVNNTMSKLFTQLEKPLLRDIKITMPDKTIIEMYPQKIPDLYAGEPILVAMKFNQIPQSIKITGDGNQPWEEIINTHKKTKPVNDEKTGITSLWARAKIEALSDRMLREGNSETFRREIIDVAFTHQLVSQFTSFVAVEEIISRPPDAAVKQEDVANLIPKGSAVNMNNSVTQNTAAYPSTATGIDLLLWSGLLLLLLFIWLILYAPNHNEQHKYAH